MCSAFCKALDDFFSPVMHGPLGGYVMSTWFVMIFVLGSGIWGIVKSFTFGSRTACAVYVALGATHAGFVYYLQRSIIVGIQKRGAHISSKKELASEALKIMLYDIGACLYCFVYIGSFVYACYSFAPLDGGGGYGYVAAVLLVLYGWFATMYLCLWYFCTCCIGQLPQKMQGGQPPMAQGAAGSQPLSGQQGQPPKGTPQPVVMGTPYP